MRCTKKHEDFRVDFIKEVCEKIGAKSPCSKEEGQCVQFLEKRLKNSVGCRYSLLWDDNCVINYLYNHYINI